MTQSGADWTLHWVKSAREVPQGTPLAGLLVDLVSGPRRLHATDTVCFPLVPAARALRVWPGLLHLALQQLSEAGLLTWHADGAPDAPEITVTVLLPPEPERERVPGARGAPVADAP
ncbi:hypothetical protein AB0G42_15730 [Streptomyces yangpuensis]|uniref:hypothetical protein n=1 Tax=Streptomyces yangpuensis TaxID=1648182 RepID=UPI00341B8B31